MKNLSLILLLFVGVFSMSSCSDEEDCTTTDINEIILGTWDYNGFDITFNADGSLDDPENAFEGSINDIDLLEDRYELVGDSILSITTFSSDPPAAVGFDHNILAYDCNEIELEVFISSVKMKKK